MIKLIPVKTNFRAQCCSCMSPTNCYEIVMNTEYGSFPITVTLCKDCLKDLQKQIKEQIDDKAVHN